MINVQRGLERLSAAWWGFWGFLAGLVFVGSLFLSEDVSDRWSLFGLGFLGVLAAAVAHRITCWIIAGFFSSRA